MTWLKNVILDLAVTACILAATVFDQTWAGWVVVIYTPLMLVLKAGVFFMPSVGATARRDDVPELVYHVLYAVDAGLLLLHGWWWTGGGWVLIWALSAAQVLKRGRPGTK